MSTLDFFTRVLPDVGTYALLLLRADGRRHVFFNTRAEMADAAQARDAEGWEAYHACASFSSRERTQASAAFTRALWLDIDVGEGKDYPDLSAAQTALSAFCEGAGMPPALQVCSGRGLHAYWPFTVDVPAQRARAMMECLHKAVTHHGLRADPTRTRDLASVLRPVGTTWKKAGSRPVYVLADAPAVSPKEIMLALVRSLPATERARVLNKPPVVQEPATDEWGAKREYPPSSLHTIAKHCPTVAHILGVRGDVAYPVWWEFAGVCRHTVEGVEALHEYSQGYAKYNRDETDRLLQSRKGVAMCKNFAEHSPHCEGCMHRNSPTHTPLFLGYGDTPQPEPASDSDAPPAVDGGGLFVHCAWDQLPHWPERGFMVRDGALWALDNAKGGGDDGEEDGPLSWVRFMPVWMYVRELLREGGPEGENFAYVTVRHSDGRWKDVYMPTSAVSSNRTLAAELGKHALYADGGEKGLSMTRSYLKAMITNMAQQSHETHTYDAFGWQPSDTNPNDMAAFVLGQHYITKDGVSVARPGRRVAKDLHECGNTAGDLQSWVDTVDFIYNRQDAELCQFVIGAAFAAPLVQLAASDIWRGIPLAITGGSGEGKTTLCHVAASIYGPPRSLTLSAHPAGTTLAAMYGRVGTLRHLPLVLDEITGRDTAELADIMYSLAQGEPKQRLMRTGAPAPSAPQWATLPLITGNLDITAMLANQDVQQAEATQMRCFEVHIPDGHARAVFGASATPLRPMIEKLLRTQYGEVGRKYLQYLLGNIDAVRKRLHIGRARFRPGEGADMRERNYHDLINTVDVALTIARDLGLVRFDTGKVREWAEGNMLGARRERDASRVTPEEALARFVSTTHPRTFITKGWPTDNGFCTQELLDNVYNPAGRVSRARKKYAATTVAFSEWCRENKVNPQWLRSELRKAGFIIEDNKRMRLFKGTPAGNLTFRVIEFDFQKTHGDMGDHYWGVEPPI